MAECRRGEGLATRGLRSIVMSMYVRSHNSKTTRPNFTNFLYVFVCLWPWLGPSCDGVVYFRFCGWLNIFTQWTYGGSLYSRAAIKHNKRNSEIPTKFCLTIKSGSPHCELRSLLCVCLPCLVVTSGVCITSQYRPDGCALRNGMRLPIAL